MKMKVIISHSLNISTLIHLGCSLSLLAGCSKQLQTNHCLAAKTDERRDSLVHIEGEKTAATSSGFIISALPDKNNVCHFYLLTTKHSLDGIDNQENFELTTNQNEKRPIKLVKYFKESDLAILSFSSSKKYPNVTLSGKIPGINSKVELVGTIKCHPEISKDSYQVQTTLGTIQDRAELDNIEVSKAKFYSLRINPGNYDQIKRKDLYYTNPAVSGMSGSPLLNDLKQVVGIQQLSLTPQSFTNNCMKRPINRYGVGTSIEKFLSQDIPIEVKQGLDIQ
jgi:Trypsin-like peptidase domain